MIKFMMSIIFHSQVESTTLRVENDGVCTRLYDYIHTCIYTHYASPNALQCYNL